MSCFFLNVSLYSLALNMCRVISAIESLPAAIVDHEYNSMVDTNRAHSKVSASTAVTIARESLDADRMVPDLTATVGLYSRERKQATPSNNRSLTRETCEFGVRCRGLHAAVESELEQLPMH